MKKRSNIKIAFSLVGLVKPLIGFMIIAILLGLMGHLAASFITVLAGFGVLDIMGFSIAVSRKTIIACMIIFAVARGFMRYIEQSCNHYIAFKLLAIIRVKVFHKLRSLCPAKLEGKDRGNLISMITSDIELLEVFYAHTISPIFIAILYSIAMVAFIGNYNVSLGILAAVAYFCVGVIVPLLSSKLSGNNGAKYRGQAGELSGFVLDSMRGLDEIIQYDAGSERLDEMTERTKKLSAVEKKMKNLSGTNMAIANTVILSFDVIMLIFSHNLCSKGLIGFDACVISTLALMSSFGPVRALADLGTTLQNTFAAGDRILSLLEEKPQIEEITSGLDIKAGEIKVDEVSFSYDSNPADIIIDKVSLSFEPGKIYGIIGKSGSGKSTLLKLIMRFWETSKGAIRINGANVNDINTRSLRDMESFMTQETHLFSGSIKSNLLVAKPDAKDSELIAACKKASIHDFINGLPEGYDTKVGEFGDTLSGGERQRIGLARAFLHDADIILLDEPTSNLDSLNESVILKSLSEEAKQKTVLLVSHRKSTMRIADKIISMESGRVS